MKLYTRKRRNWALGVLAATATVLLAGSLYLDSWRSPQYAAYNVGMQLYSAGDHICSKEEIADPIKNHCVDIESALKIFNMSMRAAAQQAQESNPLVDLVVPPPSKEVVALAALHQGVLSIMRQKPDDAVKMLKMTVVLADTTEQEAIVNEQLRNHQPVDMALVAEIVALKPIKMTAQYDLELLFQKNPSQAQQQGKGGNKGDKKGDQPDQGKPEEAPPTDGAGKGSNNRI